MLTQYIQSSLALSLNLVPDVSFVCESPEDLTQLQANESQRRTIELALFDALHYTFVTPCIYQFDKRVYLEWVLKLSGKGKYALCFAWILDLETGHDEFKIFAGERNIITDTDRDTFLTQLGAICDVTTPIDTELNSNNTLN